MKKRKKVAKKAAAPAPKAASGGKAKALALLKVRTRRARCPPATRKWAHARAPVRAQELSAIIGKM